MREIGVGADPAHLRHPAERQREIARPRVVDLRRFQLREHLVHVALELGLDVARIGAAIDRAAAEQHPLVGRETVIVEDVAHVLDAFVLRQKLGGQLVRERLGRHDLGRDRHHARREFGHDMAEIGIAAEHQPVAGDRALFGADHRARGMGVDRDHGRHLVDHPAIGLDRRRLAEREVQRVDMAAGGVEKPALVELRADVIAQGRLVEHHLVVDAEALPVLLPRLQLAHMRGRDRGEDVALLQVAIDAVARDPLADDLAALLHEAGHECRGVAAIALLDGRERGVEPVDDLAAIAPRSAPADPRAFEHGDAVALLGEVQRRRQAAIARADDADLGVMIAREHRALRRGVGRGGVVGAGMGAVPGIGCGHQTTSR